MKKNAILSWIKEHEAEMLADIEALIAIDSTKGEAEENCPFGAGPAAALVKAQAIAQSYGFKAASVDNYVCAIDMLDAERGLDILAHLDVVPVNPSEWTVTDPFTAKVKDGRLYGRGAADDKGPAVAALYAMRAIKSLGFDLKKNVRLILGSDEECGGEDIAYYYSKNSAAPCTISPDAEFPLVNVERGRYASGYTADYDTDAERIKRIVCGSKDNVIPGDFYAEIDGLSQVERQEMAAKAEGLGVDLTFEGNSLRIKGVSGHAAGPEYARNALTAALEILRVLRDGTPLEKMLSGLSDMFPFGVHYGEAAGIAMEDEICGRLTISFNRLNVSEGRLDCVFDSRVPEVANESNVIEVMRSNGEKLGLSLKEARMSRPHIVREDSPFVQTLLSCYEEVKEKKGFTMAIGGGTYVHEIENGVAFGPTELEVQTNIHGFDENIPIEDLIEAAVIYALVILRICGE